MRMMLLAGTRWLTAIMVGITTLPVEGIGQVVLSTPDTARTQVHKHLFNHRDLIIAGALTATTFALFPLDKRIATDLRDSATQANRFFGHAADGFELIASPGAYFIGGGLYLTGRLGGSSRLADLGWHGTEAVLVGEGITSLLKLVMGRSRPYVSGGSDPRDFAFFKGGPVDRKSFPSGHTTTAFAAAAAVTDETTLWWPRSTWFVGPIMYGGATMVGLSRMYHSKHWASDVALGALVGTFSGKKVVMATHDHPNNFVDRLLLGTHVTPGADGALKVGWTARVPNPAR